MLLTALIAIISAIAFFTVEWKGEAYGMSKLAKWIVSTAIMSAAALIMASQRGAIHPVGFIVVPAVCGFSVAMLEWKRRALNRFKKR